MTVGAAALSVHALVYTLSFWCCALAIILPAYLVTSLDDFGDLVRAAVTASAPAMWFAPAFLLLAEPNPIAAALGLLLAANTTRLLVSRGAPRTIKPAGVASTRSIAQQLFRSPAPSQGFFPSEPLSAIGGALAFQMGVCCLWAGYPLAAATAFAAGTAAWTRSSIRKGVYPRRDDTKPAYALLSVLMTLALATLISAATPILSDARNSSDALFWPRTQRILQRLVYAPPTAPRPFAQAHTVTRLTDPGKTLLTQKDGVPGVILRPESRPRPQAAILLPGGRRLLFSHPLTFPFTGEYHLFPESSVSIQPDSVVHKGTPLEFVYISLSGGPVETEAYQWFDPPMDFANVREVLLTLSSTETTPSSASMQIISAGRVEDLGSGIFALAPAARETLEFAVPSGPRAVLVHAIRVIFQRNPAERYQNTRVAIQQFTLLPRNF